MYKFYGLFSQGLRECGPYTLTWIGFIFIGIVIQQLLCKYLKFKVRFVRSQDFPDKTIIIFSLKKEELSYISISIPVSA